MHRCLIPAFIAVAFSLPRSALAQDPNCPPGSWFCEAADVEAPPEVAPAAPPAAAPAPPEVPAPPAAPTTTVVVPAAPAAPPPPPPPVVVVQPAPTATNPQVVIIAPGARPPPPPPPVRVVVRKRSPVRAKPVRHKQRWRSEFGLNLRLEGIALGRSGGGEEEARMGGAGLSLRFRPWRAFAIDAGVDLLGGMDYNGDKRTEIPLSLNGLLYVNPRSRVQFYFLGGVHWSHAKVDIQSDEPVGDFVPDFYRDDAGTAEYTYFGGQGGAGIDLRLWRRVSLFLDGVGFIRKRTDDNPRPEFVDAVSGRTTNTSGGAIFRGGVTFWW